MLSDAQGWLATFALGEDLRPDAPATVAALQAMGLEVRILSGDNAAAVARVADALGARLVFMPQVQSTSSMWSG